jgi:hypothetical protein
LFLPQQFFVRQSINSEKKLSFANVLAFPAIHSRHFASEGSRDRVHQGWDDFASGGEFNGDSQF